jgi:hypothetical protein
MADQTEPAMTPMRALPELTPLPGAATKGRTTEYLQGVVFGLHVAGYSNGAIARYLTISKPTVARHLGKMADVLKAAEAALPTPSTVRCQTPPPAGPPEEPGTVAHRRDVIDRYQKRHCAQHGKPASSLEVVAAITKLTHGKTVVSSRTVRYDLAARGWSWALRPVTSALDEARMKNRVEKIPQLLKDFKRKKMIFSDESMFRAQDMRSTHTWYHPAVAPCPRRKDGWAAKVHVWGAIAEDFATLVVLEETVNSESYIKTLESELLPYLEGCKDEYIFMQDGATAHKAKATMAWLAAQGIEVCVWPAWSADLNPIETLWAIMKRRLDVTCFDKAPEIIAEVMKVFNDMTFNTVQALVASFPQRCADALAVNGDDAKMVKYLQNTV